MREQPKVGQVISENDPRNGGIAPKRIMRLSDQYAMCRSGYGGEGRRSKVRLDRLATPRYSLLKDPA